nr:MAG TPA: cysteine sulfinate desulfinase/cysteine desulfurase [Caudoviricetes sp.]
MVFLDYASTCPMIRFSARKYGGLHCNPNAAYSFEERKVLVDCEERIKAAIGVKSGHVLYFRCATEAIDWFQRKTKIRDPYTWWRYSPYEHDCCTRYGIVEEPSNVADDIDFYIHQWVNHVTGEIFNLKEIKAQLPENVQLIVDATAGFGKAKLPRALDNVADALFISGHKIGCPELSFMWLSNELCEWLGAAKDIRNQWGLHHGSLSVASVLVLTDAVEGACENGDRVDGHSTRLCVQMNNMLDKACIEHHDVLERQMFTCSINAIRLNGINADALQQFLATRGIYVGVGGSACSAAHDYRVLRAYGLTDNEASEVIRVSFGEETTASDIEALVEGIKEYRSVYC